MELPYTAGPSRKNRYTKGAVSHPNFHSLAPLFSLARFRIYFCLSYGMLSHIVEHDEVGIMRPLPELERTLIMQYNTSHSAIWLIYAASLLLLSDVVFLLTLLGLRKLPIEHTFTDKMHGAHTSLVSILHISLAASPNRPNRVAGCRVLWNIYQQISADDLGNTNTNTKATKLSGAGRCNIEGFLFEIPFVEDKIDIRMASIGSMHAAHAKENEIALRFVNGAANLCSGLLSADMHAHLWYPLHSDSRIQIGSATYHEIYLFPQVPSLSGTEALQKLESSCTALFTEWSFFGQLFLERDLAEASGKSSRYGGVEALSGGNKKVGLAFWNSDIENNRNKSEVGDYEVSDEWDKTIAGVWIEKRPFCSLKVVAARDLTDLHDVLHHARAGVLSTPTLT
ncbi:uncharacterized protein BDR25DRAFT_355450 [Lindgomyces ingoldianus]|uniref:Uncharacterized protein n=1 Tax=Lindgomyces ingoldianus TaxID=673940 RepID=A0ACB6QTY3_9PLEO|nr:uncharacterized protein BDR25DRAFT_355450 [Lindgomyces ingoldianus]KAF2470336.1 hypothetical protein BDR25DRAFT_355450 [Lindgomyces ingoldianus]